jgi:hypothetical protein
VKERGGAVSRALGLAGEAAAAVKRRQQLRAPRVVLYDAAGHPRIVPAGSDAHAELVEVASELVLLASHGAAAESEAETEDVT